MNFGKEQPFVHSHSKAISSLNSEHIKGYTLSLLEEIQGLLAILHEYDKGGMKHMEIPIAHIRLKYVELLFCRLKKR